MVKLNLSLILVSFVPLLLSLILFEEVGFFLTSMYIRSHGPAGGPHRDLIEFIIIIKIRLR